MLVTVRDERAEGLKKPSDSDPNKDLSPIPPS